MTSCRWGVYFRTAVEPLLLRKRPICGLSYVSYRISTSHHKILTRIIEVLSCFVVTLQWRHNERDGVSNHQPHDCLFQRLFRRRSGFCAVNSPVTGEFPAQRASYAENVSIWRRLHGSRPILPIPPPPPPPPPPTHTHTHTHTPRAILLPASINASEVTLNDYTDQIIWNHKNRKHDHTKQS